MSEVNQTGSQSVDPLKPNLLETGEIIQHPKSQVVFKEPQSDSTESEVLNLEIHSHLGNGDNGAVYKVVNIDEMSSKPSALKVIQKFTTEEPPVEINNLKDFTEKSNRLFAEPIARNLFLQLLSALHHLHSQGIFHQDLFAQNILMTTTNNEVVLKLGDFGFAQSISLDQIAPGSTNHRSYSFFKQTDLRQTASALEILVGENDQESRGEGKEGKLHPRSGALKALLLRIKKQLKPHVSLQDISNYINYEWFRISIPFIEAVPLNSLTEDIDFSSIDGLTSTSNRDTTLQKLGLFHLFTPPSSKTPMSSIREPSRLPSSFRAYLDRSTK